MACNENTIKNMANEVTRNCQANNIPVDTDFVIYLIELLLLNPKYGKLFTKTINRNNLQYFVEECVEMLKRGDTSLHTLKMQFIIQSNYDKIQNLIDKHMDSIANCLRPLVNEILDSDPDPHEDNLTECKKLFRKISIYIILASGLGNPGLILTLKEGMAALESVFSLEDLKLFISLPRIEKVGQLDELVGVVSGVRLFNRDCKKGGESIPDLPFNLVDAGKACLTSLSNSLISVMQRVNTLTTAIDDAIVIQEETGNVVVQPTDDTDVEEFKRMFALLAFNRQYEVFTRKLLADVERAVAGGAGAVERCRAVLEELHLAVKYKAAVPTATVFPLFSKLWRVWRSMQHVMYIISVVARLVSALAATHEQVREVRPSMLNGRLVRSDQDRMNTKVPMEDRISLNFLKGYVAYNESYLNLKDKQLSAQFLGFCAMCLTVGALVPSNIKLGFIQCEGKRYSFCCTKMAAKFAKDPKRYINEVLDYARNNPELINLLNIIEEVFKVKDIDQLAIKYYAKIKVSDKDIQTVEHPIDEYIEKNYSWDLWEWKRRACQWATIVNCRTHSTQTDYSHLRSEIHCQTYEMRDKCYQTKKDQGVNTLDNSVFIWGLRGQIGYGQHYMKVGELHAADKKKAQVVQICSWPCIEAKDIPSPKGSGSEVTGENYVSSASDLDPSDQRSYIDSPLGETASTETDEPAT